MDDYSNFEFGELRCCEKFKKILIGSLACLIGITLGFALDPLVIPIAILVTIFYLPYYICKEIYKR
jgi:hypothetical protein